MSTKWTYVWLTDDGPSLGSLYPDEDAAMDAAFAEWEGYFGGTIGGYDEGTREEFDAIYAESGELWVVPIEGSG